MSTLFGWELKPETPALLAKRQLASLSICKCCSDAYHNRRQNISSNPLATILRSVVDSGRKVTLSLHSPGLNLTTSFQPEGLELRHGTLITHGHQQQLVIDSGHLHAIVVRQNKLDGVKVCELSLVNSHG